jgi:uridylate kinase
MNYKRILLKLSGESLMGDENYGFVYQAVKHYASEIKSVTDLGIQVGVVIGGGNIFRGVKGAGIGFDRRKGDYMGMLATVINSMALEAVLEEMAVKVKVMTAFAIEGLGEKIYYQNAIRYLEDGYVVIFAGGTGNPFFTTDSGAALRAVEIKADVLLKGTRVDGIYSSDPEKDPDAIKFDELTFMDAYNKELHIMDLTAFTLCRDNNMPICVFNVNVKGNLLKLSSGEKIGTIVK